MHQKEAKRQRTGTGHIAKISLKDSEILVGFEFEHNKRLQELLADPQYFPVMMYPGEEAWTAKREGFKEALAGKKLLVLILDSTWFCARKLIEHNPFLLKLPAFLFMVITVLFLPLSMNRALNIFLQLNLVIILLKKCRKMDFAIKV